MFLVSRGGRRPGKKLAPPGCGSRRLSIRSSHREAARGWRAQETPPPPGLHPPNGPSDPRACPPPRRSAQTSALPTVMEPILIAPGPAVAARREGGASRDKHRKIGLERKRPRCARSGLWLRSGKATFGAAVGSQKYCILTLFPRLAERAFSSLDEELGCPSAPPCLTTTRSPAPEPMTSRADTITNGDCG